MSLLKAHSLHPLHKFDPVIRIFRTTEHRQFMHLQIFYIIKSIEKRLQVALACRARECALAQQQDAQDLPGCSGCLCGGLSGVRTSATTPQPPRQPSHKPRALSASASLLRTSSHQSSARQSEI